MKKDAMLVTGAGQLFLAIARRMGYGRKIILGDKSSENAANIAKIMVQAGFDAEPFTMDLSSRADIQAMIARGEEYGAQSSSRRTTACWNIRRRRKASFSSSPRRKFWKRSPRARCSEIYRKKEIAVGMACGNLFFSV